MSSIRDALYGDLSKLGKLFDEYRQFYELPTDVVRAMDHRSVSSHIARFSMVRWRRPSGRRSWRTGRAVKSL